MAHTPEMRDQHPLCGAKKKNGELCRAFAGQGTKHPGIGRCKHHLGNAPNHGKHAVTLEAKRRMVTLGKPVEDITAIGALLSELYASTGHVAWLREQIADSTPEYLGTIEGQAVVRLYDSERDRKARIAKMAIDAGVEEAAIRVAEIQSRCLARRSPRRQTRPGSPRPCASALAQPSGTS